MSNRYPDLPSASHSFRWQSQIPLYGERRSEAGLTAEGARHRCRPQMAWNILDIAATLSRLRRPRSPQYRNVHPRFRLFQQSPYRRTSTPLCPDLLHALTKGCNLRTCKKRQDAPFEHPRLATCRRSLLLHSSCWYLGKTISGWIDDPNFQKSFPSKLARIAQSTCFSNF
jgi:hypothetical protein